MAFRRLPDESRADNFQLGDGFYPFKGTEVVGGMTRNARDLNGEVVPGTGLKVNMRDFYALIDGYYISAASQRGVLDFDNFRDLDVAEGTSYVVVSVQSLSGGKGPKIRVESEEPASDSGKIVAAKLTIPGGATGVTAGMIDNSVRSYLYNVESASDDITALDGRVDTIEVWGITVDDDIEALQLGKAVAVTGTTLTGPTMAGATYDQTDMQSLLDLVNDLRTKVNAMNTIV